MPSPEVEAQLKPLIIARLVNTSCRRAWQVALIGLCLGIVSVVYTASNFALTADTAGLISPKLAWRKSEAAFNKAFPQTTDVTVIVIDGATPELADTAAVRLSQALVKAPKSFLSVTRPDTGPFFDREGLLLLPLPEVEQTLARLNQAQGFLGPLAADPSLRGVMTSLSTVVLGVQQGQAKLADIDAPMKALADALERVEQGRPAYFSWQTLMGGGEDGPRLTRQFILVKPHLNFSALEPGAEASQLIRKMAGELALNPAHGVTVRLTGGVPLADEQFGSLLDRAWLMGAAMGVSILVMLWLAVRSLRMMICIMAVTLIGLVITTAVGLFAVHTFNLISVAFIPLFVGLGVDFGIQFCVRCQAERLIYADLQEALVAAGRSVGGSLALAAAAIAVGFFTFIPTNYIGVSELGIIAGLGMVVAFGLSVTLLPALLTLAKPPGAAAEVGIKAFAPLDDLIVSHRKRILIGFAAAAVVSLALTPLLRFDFDPLHMENPHAEAMATLLDMMKDPDETPNTIDILEPSLAQADDVAARLNGLPQVSHALTLSTFVPDQQTQKLALINDAAAILSPTLTPFAPQPPPSDAEVVASLQSVAASLNQVAGAASAPASADARRLADALQTLAKSPPQVRAQATQTVIAPLQALFNRIRLILQAQPVTRASLPNDLVSAWIAPDGRARIQVFPKGDSNSNKVLVAFSKAVLAVAPEATGTPIAIQEAGKTIVGAFVEAFILSFIASIILLWIVLRRIRDVALTMAPVLLTGVLTLATCALTGQALNYANIIAFPLLFGIGVAFSIYFVIAWRKGETHLLQSSLTRAIVFSALTTGTSFGSLWLSSHPGTASMGKVLMIALLWILVTVIMFEPALLGPPPRETETHRL